jgi:adenylosuccinate synthase
MLVSQPSTAATLGLIGGQWGDEGKAKLVDVLAQQAHAVVRSQGGCNAGHTVCHGEHTYKFHHVPTGVLHPGVVSYLGNGVVIHPLKLADELTQLANQGVDTCRLVLSPWAHITLPWHCDADQHAEATGQGLGTTGRGIGPTYQAKVGRIGLRVADLAEPDDWLLPRLTYLAQRHHQNDVTEALPWVRTAKQLLLPLMGDVSLALHGHLQRNERVLFEGAQGALLDIDLGTYPYVTSSNAGAAGLCTGSGLGPTQLTHVMGIFKAYCTRVGEGPFPTEATEAEAATLRRLGHEVGTTTGRPRRCGWFDAVLARYAVLSNGITQAAITKSDVLDTLERIPVCVGYQHPNHSEVLRWPPQRQSEWQHLTPVYEWWPGWQQPTQGITEWDALPDAPGNLVELPHYHGKHRAST